MTHYLLNVFDAEKVSIQMIPKRNHGGSLPETRFNNAADVDAYVFRREGNQSGNR